MNLIVDGAGVGAGVGCIVGLPVGDTVGMPEGAGVGLRVVGANVGVEVVGADVGVRVSVVDVGVTEGERVGAKSSVGLGVCVLDAFVGAAVGNIVGMMEGVVALWGSDSDCMTNPTITNHILGKFIFRDMC